MGYYPIAVELANRKCLVVGGGEVALRKVTALADAGARVTVIAAEVDPRIEAVPEITIERRAYRQGDAAGFTLIFAATDDRAVNTAVSAEAESLGVPVNVVDDPELCSFIVPAVVRRGELMIAILTSGGSPALSKKIRREIEQRYGPEYGDLVELMRSLRDEVKARYATQPQREAVFGKLLDCGILELLREGRTGEAREKAMQCI